MPVVPQTGEKPTESVMIVEVVERPNAGATPAGGAVQPVETPPAPTVRRPTPSAAEQQLDAARSLRSQGRLAEAAAAAQRAQEAFRRDAESGDIHARNGAGMAKALKDLCEREQQAGGGSG